MRLSKVFSALVMVAVLLMASLTYAAPVQAGTKQNAAQAVAIQPVAPVYQITQVFEVAPGDSTGVASTDTVRPESPPDAYRAPMELSQGLRLYRIVVSRSAIPRSESIAASYEGNFTKSGRQPPRLSVRE